jgi:hypothetical protein
MAGMGNAPGDFMLEHHSEQYRQQQRHYEAAVAAQQQVLNRALCLGIPIIPSFLDIRYFQLLSTTHDL